MNNRQWQDGRFDVSRLVDNESGRILARVLKESATGDTEWEQWSAVIYRGDAEVSLVSIGQYWSRECAKRAVEASL